MNKKILFIISASVIILTGCNKETKEYRQFVERYGSETRTFCDGAFLMRETFLSPEASAPQEYLINSNVCKTN